LHHIETIKMINRAIVLLTVSKVTAHTVVPVGLILVSLNSA
jgi:hypothetical protein